MISSLSSYGGQSGVELRKYLFGKIDANSDSSVSKDELLSALGQSGSDKTSGTASQDVDKLFSALDSDGNGSISEAEFMAPPPPPRFDNGTSQALLSQQEEDQSQISDLFTKADTNGDGTLSQDELSALLQNGPGGQDAADKASDLFAKLDSDGDGTVSEAEFAAGRPRRHHHQSAASQTDETSGGTAASGLQSGATSVVDSLFSKLDTDGDGQVSQDEWYKQRNAAFNSTSTNLSAGRMDSAMLAYMLQNVQQQQQAA